MIKHIFVDNNTEFPYGTRLILRTSKIATHRGTCVGRETKYSAYRGYLILRYNDSERGHTATNEKGEEFQNCWWIERGTEILEVKIPFEPAGICDIL